MGQTVSDGQTPTGADVTGHDSGSGAVSAGVETPSSFVGRAEADGGFNFHRASFAQVKRGKLVDNYSLLEELGTGSFGVVNKAQQIRGEGLRAIKTITKKRVKDPAKLKAEFNVIRSLDHPNICKAYECYEDRKNIYLVMELLTGGTLLETLCVQTKFTEADAAHIMRQMLSALAYLHERNFVFRDLKTENIMFRVPASGDEERDGTLCKREVKLIDFGLCCPIEKGSKMFRAAGTPYTVAPELVSPPVQYDQKCDSWSAGVVLYTLLSGKYPFNGKTKEELLHKIRRQPCSFSHPAWRRISKEAKTFLAELLRKQADQRISVSEALMHPWLGKRLELPSENIMGDVMDSFKHFQNLNMFQRAAVTALAWRTSDEETTHLREIFTALDRDGNGHITAEELRDAMETAGVDIPINFEELANVADTDGGGSIEYTEFLAACIDKQKIIKEEVVWEAFRIFDADESGKITKKELLKLLNGVSGDRIRQVHGNTAIESFLGEYDSTGDDAIDFEEFMCMLQNVKSTYSDHKKAHMENVQSMRDWPADDTDGVRRTSTNAASKGSPFANFFQGLFGCPCCSIQRGQTESVAAGDGRPRRAPQQGSSMRRSSLPRARESRRASAGGALSRSRSEVGSVKSGV
mmetsp:Transcript_60798/g.131906  ORF Transcript_60798/g.131906 Transcript_60798/m.131906 type:complete len:636 (-) Transcript_60798:45-1952(-)